MGIKKIEDERCYMITHRTRRMQRFARWLFGSPFRQSAAPLGDLVPPEIRVFEARTAEIQHQKRNAIRIGAIRQWRTKVPVKR